MNAKAAVGGKEASAASDLSVRRVSDAGFNGVVLIFMPFIARIELRRNRNRQFTVCIKLTCLLRLLLGIVHVGLVVTAIGRGIDARTVSIYISFIPPVVWRVIDAVLDLRIRNRFSEEVSRVNRDLVHFALQNAR